MAPERTLQTKGRGNGVATQIFLLTKAAFSGSFTIINCHRYYVCMCLCIIYLYRSLDSALLAAITPDGDQQVYTFSTRNFGQTCQACMAQPLKSCSFLRQEQSERAERFYDRLSERQWLPIHDAPGQDAVRYRCL